jgi:uncharacterized protein YjbJ (UPF0337 family)
MNWDAAERNWPQFRSEVRANWGRLSDSHLAVIAGKRPRLASTISEAYGVTDVQAEQQIRNFEARNLYSRPVSGR